MSSLDNPLILTFDVGTQSARCLLVKTDGSFEDIHQVKYETPYYSPNPGWAEQKADFYYEQICEAGKIIAERNKDKLDRVIAVTLTVIRDTVLCLDKDNKPLRDIILWLDKRQADFNDPFPLYKKALFKLVGMGEATKIIYQASVCNWIMQYQPEIWEKTAKYVMLPTYLNYRITGNLVDSEANMIGHIPFDYQKRVWRSKNNLNRCICDVPSDKCCDLVKSGEELGKISKEFSEKTGIPEGLPLIATGSDKGCETVGLSVVHKNQAAISLGTTATVQLALKKYVEPQRFMPAYPAVPNDMFNPEIEIYRGFWLISWFINEFGAKDELEAKELGIHTEKLLDEKIKELPPGCDGLLLQPYWTPGVINPTSKGAVIGFSDHHTRYHLYRAIIEGLGFELYHSLKNMEKRAKLNIDEVYIAGGGARSDIVCQIFADIIGLPVKTIQTHEACSIGASMVAFISKGVFKNYDDAIASMVHNKKVFVPNEENHKAYMVIYKSAYSKIFGSLEHIYKKTIKLTKRFERRQKI